MAAQAPSYAGAVKSALAELGVVAGAMVMVHSDLRQAGLVREADGRLGLRLDAASLFAAFMDLLAPQGTLVVPTFTFSWSKGCAYDPASSKSDQGAFSEYVRRQSGARRSSNPMTSIAAFGGAAIELSGDSDDYCFGPESPHARIVHHDALQVMVGARWNSLNDHIQVTHGTPCRYPKYFPDPMPGGDGIRLCRHDVRYRVLGDDLRTTLDVVGSELGDRLRTRRIGDFELHAVSTRALTDVIRKRIEIAPYEFQKAPARTIEIDRIDVLHRWLAASGGRHFAIDAGGHERWLYILPPSLMNGGDTTADGEHVIATFRDSGPEGDDSRMLDHVSEAADDIWRALRERLHVVARCPAGCDLGFAADVGLRVLA